MGLEMRQGLLLAVQLRDGNGCSSTIRSATGLLFGADPELLNSWLAQD